MNRQKTSLVFHSLCRPQEIPPGGRAFELEHGDHPLNVFVVPADSGFRGYVNRCPHTGVNLEWQPDQSLDISGRFIQCATHGAKFRITDGYCVAGPCAGDGLTPVPLRLEGDFLEVGLPSRNTSS
ncbi:MAG: Rieske 2Fe-2S domain-containing protein [Thiotrichales bacterium]|nr:Rieske 2Fe-2S domain-containing protein [Thiotrichales bacterium]